MTEETTPLTSAARVSLREVTSDNLDAVIRLSETLNEAHRHMVAPNAVSLAQAHFSPHAWYRAIYAEETPIGFMMMYEGLEDGNPDQFHYFLWRFMIGGKYHKMGFGRRALELLFQPLRALGVNKLKTSCGEGEGSPEGFYRRLGFKRTGEQLGDEVVLVLDLSAYPLPPAEEALSAGILAPAWMRQQRLEAAQALLPVELRHPGVLRAVEASLAEDLNAEGDLQALWPDPAQGDITSQATLDPNSWLEGRITAKAAGVIAGLPLAQSVFYLVEPRIQFKALVADGQGVEVGALLAEVSGPGPALLAAERPALNFLGRMSGIATLSRRFAEAVAGTKAIVLDTRKTAPGLRHLDKYAVAMGGSGNHRAGLYDMILIKDNHIDGAGGIPAAVERVRKAYGEQYKVEVEVKNLEELQIALSQPIQRIMLDNMSLAEMRQAVKMTAGKVELEASGNVSLATVRAIAETGVDFISSGALTHSAAVLDISLRLR